ncbi:MAG: preprotein translocase subunit SecY [Anaerorhabdus sp.]
MIETCIKLFKNKDTRNKILFTLAMLFIYRLGAAIPVPGVNLDAINTGIADSGVLSMMNLLGGGALQQFSIFAMGVGPYITASIVIQLLSMDVIPALTEMAKSGQKGRQQMDKITRYLAVILAFVQSYFMVWGFDVGNNILEVSSLSNYLYTATILTAGTMFLLWIGDRISTKGVGNGVSIIIFAGIVSGLPTSFTQTYQILVDTSSQTAMVNGLIQYGIYVIMYLVIILLVVFMQMALRKIPIQYTSSGATKGKTDVSFLPFKINSASVIPVIFAQSIMQIPAIASFFFPNNSFSSAVGSVLDLTKPLGLLLYAVFIVFFTFFYTNLQVDPEKVAENLGKGGAYIPGIRPGKETKEHISKVLNRITVLGAAGLCFLAILPYLLTMFTSLPSSIALGGTGIIIVVGVAMETTRQLKGQLTQKSYRGFLR